MLDCCCCLDAIILALAIALIIALAFPLALALTVALVIALAIAMGQCRAMETSSPLHPCLPLPESILNVTVDKDQHEHLDNDCSCRLQ